MELTIDRLSKQFGSHIAVDRVSTTLTPGVYGLLGNNGAGKTTLMRMLCDVLKPTSGSIYFNGNDITKLGEQYRDALGYLPQDFGYYPDFKAIDFLCYVASLKDLDKRRGKMKAEELLEMVGLKDSRKSKIGTFSGGMKQRLGIAQAVLNDPKVLILDEPTAGLDPKERVRFRNLISSFSTDKIVVLSTHIVSDIEYIANDIMLMKSGQLVKTGTPEDISQLAQNKVWQCEVSQQEADMLASRLNVGNVHYGSDGKAIVRIVSSVRPHEHARPIEPSLEDAFLVVFEETSDTMENKG